jgi:hypothetical protein
MMKVWDMRSPLNWTVAGLGMLDMAAAVALSVYAAGLTSGVLHTNHPHGGVGASIGVLAMTLPVAWRRPAPLVVAGVMAASAVLNGLIFGSMVRCGATLPALFLVVYAVGARCDKTRSNVGLLLCAAATFAEGISDPQIGAKGQVVVLPVLAGAGGGQGTSLPARRDRGKPADRRRLLRDGQAALDQRSCVTSAPR